MKLTAKEILDTVKNLLETELVTNGDCAYCGYYAGEFEKNIEELRCLNFPAIYISYVKEENDLSDIGARHKILNFAIAAAVQNLDGVSETAFGQTGAINIQEQISELIDGKDLGLKDKSAGVFELQNTFMTDCAKDIAIIISEYTMNYYYCIG